MGLATAPILAQSLGIAGRGELSAALAPGLIVVSVAAFGFSESITYHYARESGASFSRLWQATGIATAISIPAIALAIASTPLLSNGDQQLANLMILGTALSMPGLYTGFVRSVAAGRHLWTTMMLEKVATGLLRLFFIVAFAAAGALDVVSALVITTMTPVAALLIYWPSLLRQPKAKCASQEPSPRVAGFVKYAARSWIGSLAVMLLGRMNQLLLTPLSSVEQMGLLAVAVTISDLPFIVSTSVRDVLFAVGSASEDLAQLARVSRITLLLTLFGSGLIGGTLPLWMGKLFGEEFESAIGATVVLLMAQVVAVPGLMMGAAAAALGLPGLRSVSQVLGLVTNVLVLTVLAPALGALGAALAALVASIVIAAYCAIALSRMSSCRAAHFWVLEWSDAKFMWRQVSSAAESMKRNLIRQ